LKENLRNEVVGSTAIKVHQAESSRERADHGEDGQPVDFCIQGTAISTEFHYVCIANLGPRFSKKHSRKYYKRRSSPNENATSFCPVCSNGDWGQRKLIAW